MLVNNKRQDYIPYDEIVVLKEDCLRKPAPQPYRHEDLIMNRSVPDAVPLCVSLAMLPYSTNLGET